MEHKAAQETLVDYELVKWHFVAFAVYLLIGVLAGLAYATQFLNLYPFEGIELLSPGRVRMTHTQDVAYGMIANGFFGIIYYIIPKLTNQSLLSKRLAWITFALYNLLVLLTVVLIQAGFGQGLEWAETPAILDPFIAITVVAIVINILTPVIRSRSQSQYVSVWYILAALIWTPLVYVMGNFLPQYIFPGTGGAAISSMYIHDLVGLFVTPIGIGITYYLLPVVMNRPLYSHALSLIGFWGLALFYPLNSVHHYLYSPIPMWAQYASVVASVGMHVVVYTVVFNVFATIASNWRSLLESTTVKFIFMGALIYLATCIQCAIHVTLSVQEVIHFTDWVVGHSHLILFGTFGFWIFAWFYYLMPRILGTPIFSEKLAIWQFWLGAIGIWLMGIDLGVAGLIQGELWRKLAPFIDSVEASVPYWWVRMFAGVMIFVSVMLFLINFVMTWRERKEP